MSWVSIGPSSARRGQAATFPAISGRVSGIALSRQGQRIYISTANGGVWRSDDRGVTWRPLMDRFDRNPAVATSAATGVDTLSCGAIAIHPDHPDTLFVGTGEGATFEYFGVGIIVSTDAGLTWTLEEETTAQDGQPSSDLQGAGCYALAVHPTDPHIVVAATTRGVYQRQLVGGQYLWSQRRIRPDTSGRDGSLVDVTSVVVASAGANPPVFYAVTRGWNTQVGQVYRSVDNGTTWAQLGAFPAYNPAPAHQRESLNGRSTLAVKHDDPNFLYVRTANGAIFRWNGTGANQWDRITRPTVAQTDELLTELASQGHYNLAMSVDPIDGERIFVGSATSLITRADGERIWSATFYRLTLSLLAGPPPSISCSALTMLGSSMHADIHAIVFKPGDPNELWVGGDGGLFFTTTPQGAGDIFTQRNAGIASLLTHKLASHPHHESVLYAGSQDNGCMRYTGEETWFCAVHSDAGCIVLNKRHPERLVIGYVENSLFGLADGGLSNRTGSSTFVAHTLDTNILFYPPIVGPPAPATDAEADRVAWGAERVWLSEDFGANFNPLPTPAGRSILSSLPFNSGVNDSRLRSLCFADQTHLFAGLMNGEVYYYTENPGAATPWPAPQRLDSQPGLLHTGNPIQQPVTDIAADPRTPGACFITFGGFGDHPRVWYYDGAAWHNRSGANADVNQNLMTVQVNCIVIDAPADPAQPLRLYIGVDIGVWRSLDAGLIWELWANGLPDSAVLDLDIFTPSRLIRAATYGRGVFERHLEEATRTVHLFARDHQMDTGRIASTLAAADIDNPTGPTTLAAIETATITAAQNAYNAAIGGGQTENQARQAEITAAQNTYTAQLAAAPDNHVTVHSSPDIKIDAPDASLQYQFASDECLEFLRFVDIFTDESQALAFTDTHVNVLNRVYVQVHNRGSVWAHRVQVMLLIAVENAGAVPDLPEDFEYSVRRGTPINREGWRTVGLRSMSDLHSGHPQVTRFELPSDLLKEMAAAATPDLFQLLVLLHHKDDPFVGSTRVFADLVANDRLVASKRVRATLLTGVAVPPPTVLIANSWKPIGPSGILRGQCGSQATMSGRVSGIAVGGDGKRIYAATASGGVWRSDDQGRRWHSLMDSINFDPLYQSAGEQMLGVTTLSCGAIALDPRNADTMYVGTGEAPGLTYLGDGVLVSENGGISWTREQHGGPAGDSLGGAGFYMLAVDPDPAQAGFVFGATNIGLYKRQAKIGTAGFEWLRIAVSTLPAHSRCTSVLVARRGGSSHFFVALPNVGAGGQFFETWDQGAHWQQVGTGYPTGKRRIALAVFLDQGTAAAEDVLYAINDDGEVHRAARTSGVQGAWSAWSQVSGTPDNIEKQGDYNRGFAIAPDNKNRLYIGGAWVWSNSEYSGFLYRCDISGSGTSWSMATTFLGNSIHPDLHTLVFAQNDPHQLWVGCDGGVFYTNNALATDNLDTLFRSCNDGLQAVQFTSIGQHPGQEAVVIGGTQDNGALRYTGDEAWILSAGGDGGAACINRTDPARFFSAYILNEYRISTSGGGRYSYTNKSIDTGYAENDRVNHMLFYPPYAFTPAATGAAGADLVAFGEKKVWLNTQFGEGDWQAITGDLGERISALEFATLDLLYAGTTNGLVYKIEKSGGTWQAPVPLHATPTDFSSITSIAVHPAHTDRFYITLGGSGGTDGGLSRLHYYDGSNWHNQSGTGGTALLDTQINKLVIDPDTPDHLYVAADIGLWRSTNGGTDWQVFNNGIPETAIISLAVFKAAGHKKLLRAVTHGRGMYEYTLDDADALAIELYLRDHQLDRGWQGSTTIYGNPDPTDLAINTALGTSPDIKIDAPDSDGNYQFADREELGFVDFIGHLTDNSAAVPVHRVPISSHVYVLVHNRGREEADGVTVVVLVSNAFSGDTPPQLPENFRLSLLAHGKAENEDWKTLGSVMLDDLRCAHPRAARFNLPSDLLAAGDNLEDDKKHALVAFVFHENDRLVSDERTLTTLTNTDRHVAVRFLTTSRFSGTLPGVEYGLERNSPFMLAVGVSMLACEKIKDLADKLQKKQGTGGSTVFRDTDRRLLALALQSTSCISESEDITAQSSLPLKGRFSRFVMMGCMGWNLPDYVDWLSPEQGWIGTVLKRGSVDPDLSHRAVPSAEFVIRMAEIALAAAPDADKKKIRAFTLGMLHALAAQVVLNPALRGLQADYGPQDWDHDALTADEVACTSFVSRQLLDALPEREEWINWWPESEEVPDSLFQGFQQAMVEKYDPASARARKFGDHPEAIETEVPSAEELRDGYDLFRRTLSPNLHWAWWLLLLSPIFLMPPLALLIARFGLSRGKKLFTEADGDPDEQSYYEVLSLTGFMSSVAPFAYSMYLWSLFPRQNGHFTQALIAGITRMLAGAFYTVSYAVSTPLPAAARWPVFGLSTAFDIWFLIRGIVHAAEDEPGYARLNFLQTVPALSMIANLLFCGLMQIKRNDIAFWILWALWTAGAITGCVFSALAFARSDNLVSLLRNRKQQYIGMDRLGRDTAYRPGKTFARVFAENTLWHEGDPNRENQRYPSGPRALVTVVAPADSNWTFHCDGHHLSFKDSGGTTHGPLELTTASTAADLAAQITALVAALTVTTMDSGDLLYPLPFPDAFSDPGDTCSTQREHDAHQGDFLPISEDADTPTPICHVPRSVIATAQGIPGSRCSSDERLRMLPAAPGNDFAGTLIDKAAELGALLSLAAAPVLNGGTVPAPGVTGDAPVTAVSQVFRRWNLSERHLAEWQTLFGSGAAAETLAGVPVPPPAPAADGQPVRPGGVEMATGLGWISAFVAWKTMAIDPAQDSEAADSMADNPVLRQDAEPPLHPTNRDLSNAMNYLFDLEGAG